MKWAKDGKDYLTLPGKSSTTEIRELERVTSKLRIGDATQVHAGCGVDHGGGNVLEAIPHRLHRVKGVLSEEYLGLSQLDAHLE